MKVVADIDPLLLKRELKDLLQVPVVIRVNKFNELAAHTFISEMEKAHRTGQTVIPVVIDSYGGQVYSLLAMVDAIKSSKIPVATIVEGKAMSCGAILLSYGEEGMRYAGPNSTIMIHDISKMTSGKVEEVKVGAEQADRLNQMVFKNMSINCGQDKEYILKEIHSRGHADWYLTPRDAKKMGLVNHIRIPDLEVKITTEFSFK